MDDGHGAGRVGGRLFSLRARSMAELAEQAAMIKRPRSDNDGSCRLEASRFDRIVALICDSRAGMSFGVLVFQKNG